MVWLTIPAGDLGVCTGALDVVEGTARPQWPIPQETKPPWCVAVMPRMRALSRKGTAMSIIKGGFGALLLLSIPVLARGQAAANHPPAATAPTHPREVAFVDEGERGWVYRKFPSGVRLYTYDRDVPGRSVCNANCVGPWPPVYAPPGARSVGQWSVIQRDDGTQQWALNGKPVYMRFHDTPDVATGDGVDGEWHVIPHMQPAAEQTAKPLRPQ